MKREDVNCRRILYPFILLSTFVTFKSHKISTNNIHFTLRRLMNSSKKMPKTMKYTKIIKLLISKKLSSHFLIY